MKCNEMEYNEMELKILDSLEPMFQEAMNKGLVFRARYHDRCFTPVELMEEHRRFRFIWGQEKWRLVDPNEHAKFLDEKIISAIAEKEEWIKRVGSSLRPSMNMAKGD